jgi:hypothetical protein
MSDEAESENEETEEDPLESLNLPEGRGVLTKGHREFMFAGLDDPAFAGIDWEGDVNQKRWRIRQRVKAALHDFKLLSDPAMFSDRDLEIALDDVYVRDPSNAEEYSNPDPDADGARRFRGVYGWGEQLEHLIATMSFLHRAADVVPMLSFEDLVEAGIRENIPRHRENPNGVGTLFASRISVDASIDVDVQWSESLDVDDIEEKLERGEQLSREEIGELFVHGRIERGDLGADDVDPSLFNTSSPGNVGPDPLPGLDPPRRSPPEDWEEQTREKLTKGMAETVDWDAAERPEEVWEQLREHYESPTGYAMELELEGDRAEERLEQIRQDLLTDELNEKVDWDAVETPRDVWEQLEEHYDDPHSRARELREEE